MFVDTETGTIVNGPLLFIPDAFDVDFEGLSDSSIVETAEDWATVKVTVEEADYGQVVRAESV